jgi:hypothetical protein
MQKNLLSLVFLILALPLFSQVKTGDVILSLDGNYMKTYTGGGVTTNMTGSRAHNLDISLSAGYFFTERVVAGIGIDYKLEKGVRSNLVNFNNFIQAEEMDYKSYAWLPNAYVGLYFPIVNKLYVTANFKVSYGKINASYTTTYAGGGKFLLLSPTTNYMYVSSADSKADFFSNMIYPEVLYFLGEKTSLSLGLGGIQYALTDWDTHNAEVAVNFNPVHWKLGVKMKL